MHISGTLGLSMQYILKGAIIFYRDGGRLFVGGPEFFGVVKGWDQFFFSVPKGGPEFFEGQKFFR